MVGLRYRRVGGGVVEMSSSAVAHMESHRQLEPGSHEAGGVLLGRFLMGCEDVVVNEAVGPFDTDSRSRYQITRKRSPAQELVNEAWRASRGTCNYLGEWHTHPEYSPSPSWSDLRNWRHIAKDTRTDLPAFFFGIMGLDELIVWEAGLTLAGRGIWKRSAVVLRPLVPI
jgi:integrative and conjugative element protein (TIGR02256 family)